MDPTAPTSPRSDSDRFKEDLARLRDEFEDLFDAALEVGKDCPGAAREKLALGIGRLKRACLNEMTRGGRDAAGDLKQRRSTALVLLAAILCAVGILIIAAALAMVLIRLLEPVAVLLILGVVMLGGAALLWWKTTR